MKKITITIVIIIINVCLISSSIAASTFGMHRKDRAMTLEELKKQYQLINLFVELAEVPSPSKKEDALIKQISSIMDIYGINHQKDSYGNIIAKIPASSGYRDVEPLLLSAHMDVVGGSEPVNVRLSKNGKYIETDKTRTLGADNKAGVAVILDLAIKLNDMGSKIQHGPIEITFTRDEEMGMSGIHNLDTSKISAKYAIIADGEYLGEHDAEGAGFTNIYITVTQGKGGHSGINIADANRVNAIKVLSELDTMIPQGVFKQDERGVLTSINAGVSVGGSADTSVSEFIKEVYRLGRENKPLPEKYSAKNMLDTISKESAVNIINTDSRQTYSLRSSDPDAEKQLLSNIQEAVNTINSKYNGKIQVRMVTEQHLKPFVKSNDTFLSEVIQKAGEKTGISCPPGSFHAGAETHILANEKNNGKNEKFIPVIIGVANLENIHSADEKMDWESFIKGKEWLENIVTTFAEEHKK